jgi:hypothetical protein
MTGTAQKLLAAFDDRRAVELMRELLHHAGITVGGDAPWDIQIHDERVYRRVLRDGTLGAGESYVEGWWDCQAIDQMLDRLTRARIENFLRESWVLLAKGWRRCSGALEADDHAWFLDYMSYMT